MCLNRRALLTAVAAFALGCPSEAPKTPAPPAPVIDAGPPAPPPQLPLELKITGTLVDGGSMELPAADGGLPLLEQSTALEVISNQPLINYRVRVFDEADRAMVSDDETSDEPGPIRYAITFPEPLKTGHRYAVVIDAQTGAAFTDAQGRPLPDHRVELKIAGERVKAPPPPKKRRRR
jgi:hypothetical protein